MLIFLAGVHGVGKTSLAKAAESGLGFMAVSASTLIRQELTVDRWLQDKRTASPEANQMVLLAAVQKIKVAKLPILLDGHFVLLNSSNDIVAINIDVFRTIDPDHIVLITEKVETILARLAQRDSQFWTLEKLEELRAAETLHANQISAKLDIPLTELSSPSQSSFVEALRKILFAHGKAAK